ncbi:hypothetical protein J7400_16260 [Shimia sp. R9_2]|uniref:hypothetical protein n=1 Tax=Shimia sp. R9_2 TaxID=2821112 RepID=UPI001ADCB6F7|nr:hypothetical protein [Shimia sp. R9_2]MBO9398233.1 hypothetical protein [Shimia sp. R9_2]
MTVPIQTEIFQAAAKLFQRGGPLAPACGARTRNGGECANPPIKEGKGRCLSHCGPKAAKAFRERQKRRFEAGQVSAEEWNRAEARRTANRLGHAWKKNPWQPGSTIDLGEHEAMFVEALGGIDVASLAPAVADWLRWRYQRLQIDTRNDAAWMDVRLNKLPARVERAAQYSEAVVGGAGERHRSRAVWQPSRGASGASARRSLPDRPRIPKPTRRGVVALAGRPRVQPVSADEQQELMDLYRDHVSVLRPIMGLTVGEARQWAVLRTLRAHLNAPQDAGAHQRWLALVQATIVPPMNPSRSL